MDRLTCTVMPYPWGSHTAIAELTGRTTPSARPEAELWMGAHPVAPSRISRDGMDVSLEAIIARDPVRELGDAVVRELGPRLPFLLKVLAIAEPLSLQAHPNAEQAERGWLDEERRGVPRDASLRNYRDASHKPELLCALTPVDALTGFRAIDHTLRLFDMLAISELEPILLPLRTSQDARGLSETFRALMTMPVADRARVVDLTVEACAAHHSGQAYASERAWAIRLASLYPGDIGVVSALFLELVHLDPGDAIYLGAGNLHAYLQGTGVEIMASSDNVLRGGLTKKHVDVPELLRVLEFDSAAGGVVKARPIDTHESVYDAPACEFRLSKLHIDSSREAITREVDGPEILLATARDVYVAAEDEELMLTKGSAVFIPACTPHYRLRAAHGPQQSGDQQSGDQQSGEQRGAVVFRATVNLG